MRLTTFTDYGLRVLMYVATHEEDWIPVSQIAEAHDISTLHLQKAANALTSNGWVEGRRGRGGGLRLAKDPSDIRIGEVIRSLEQGVPLVECFDADSNACKVTPACVLKRALKQAERAFYAEADQFTLADLAKTAAPQRRLLAIAG